MFRSVGGASKGIWVAPASFADMGPWGAQITLDSGGGSPKVARMNFQVRDGAYYMTSYGKAFPTGSRTC